MTGLAAASMMIRSENRAWSPFRERSRAWRSRAWEPRQAFRRKYLAIASSPVPSGPTLFELSPAEEATVELIRSLQRSGAGEDTLERRLDELHETLTSFSEEDVELLDEAGLILRPDLGQLPQPASP